MTLVPIQPLSEAHEASLLPRVLPVGWERLDAPGPAYVNTGFSAARGLMVLFSGGIEEDGCVWLHVSVSRSDRVPTWEDLVLVKRLFIGDARWAYQCLVPEREHYTLPDGPGRMGKVLHLWAPEDGKPRLPNFLRARGGTL